MQIERTLFWFDDGYHQSSVLNDAFFAYGTLLNRLLNKHYSGKKIKFINIYFYSQHIYELYPKLTQENAYYYGGHLQYYGLIDFIEFGKFNDTERIHAVWKSACNYVERAGHIIKNQELSRASKLAFNEGCKSNLNPDYKLLETELVLYGKIINASVWVNFKKDGMYSKLTLDHDGIVLFQQDLDKTKNGIEIFLVMYKKIYFDGKDIILKGLKTSEGNLPMRIPISKQILETLF